MPGTHTILVQFGPIPGHVKKAIHNWIAFLQLIFRIVSELFECLALKQLFKFNVFFFSAVDVFEDLVRFGSADFAGIFAIDDDFLHVRVI